MLPGDYSNLGNEDASLRATKLLRVDLRPNPTFLTLGNSFERSLGTEGLFSIETKMKLSVETFEEIYTAV